MIDGNGGVAPYRTVPAEEPFEAPYSAGKQRSRLTAPLNACDCHHHIYDTRVPSMPPERAKPDASVADYRLLQRRLGTTRSVIVTASNYMDNNKVAEDAIEQFGAKARGIAVVSTSVTDTELKRLNDKGFRGIRIARIPRTPWEDVRLLSKRIASLGWHIQISVEIEHIVEQEGLLSNLPTDIVFDHFARVGDIDEPGFKVVMRLIEKGRAWVKLSGLGLIEPDGAPHYRRCVEVARAYVKAAPENVVWGSDWPHPSTATLPDDALMFDLNRQWAPTEALQKQILVRNPERLYDFDKTPDV